MVFIIVKEDKFDGTNYYIWRDRMVEILKFRRLWGYVGGFGIFSVVIFKSVVSDELVIWEEVDQVVRILLQLSVKSFYIGVF